MIIGLIDVDGKGTKRAGGGSVYPNLALGKIARFHKEKGDVVEWAKPIDLFNRVEYDIIYASKVFNFSKDVDYKQYKFKKLIKGGTGYDINSKLPREIETLQPLYDIYPDVDKKTAFGFLTRGCPNNCYWCVVPKKEGKIYPYMDVEEIAIEGRTNIVLMDNNILGGGGYALDQLRKIAKLGYRIDFNQAMDARLVNDENAELLARCKWINNRVRFGCDTTPQIKQCEKAMYKLKEHGYKGDFFLYTMVGGKNDFAECYNRINYFWNALQEYMKTKNGFCVYAYAQPYRDPENTGAIIPQWQKDLASWCNKRQIFCTTSFKDFEPRKGFKCAEYFKDQDERQTTLF